MKLTKLAYLLLTGLFAGVTISPAQQDSATVEARVNSIVNQMTFTEKLEYVGGTGFFDIKPIPVPNLKVPINPQIYQTDGPLGVRRNEPSVRFP